MHSLNRTPNNELDTQVEWDNEPLAQEASCEQPRLVIKIGRSCQIQKEHQIRIRLRTIGRQVALHQQVEAFVLVRLTFGQAYYQTSATPRHKQTLRGKTNKCSRIPNFASLMPHLMLKFRSGTDLSK